MDAIMIARSMALNAAYFRDTDFELHYGHDTAGWATDSADDRFLRLIFYGQIRGRMLWCNRHVHRAGIETLVDAMLEEYRQDPSRKRYFLTFCWDAGSTWERLPDVDLVSLKNIINHRLRRLGLHGIGVVEVDVLTNITGEPGRRLLFHIHCYCWTRGEIFHPYATARNLRKSRAFPNDLGARSVVIKPVTLSEISVARLAQYMFKFPSRAKNRVPRRNNPGSYYFADTTLPSGSAARLVEVLSHLEFGNVLFSVGDGGELADDARARFGNWVESSRGRTAAAPDDGAITAHWADVRKTNGSRNFGPCRIITRPDQRG